MLLAVQDPAAALAAGRVIEGCRARRRKARSISRCWKRVLGAADKAFLTTWSHASRVYFFGVSRAGHLIDWNARCTDRTRTVTRIGAILLAGLQVLRAGRGTAAGVSVWPIVVQPASCSAAAILARKGVECW